MATPDELVANSFAQAQTYANDAKAALTGFTDAMNAAIYTPPTLSVTWNSLTAPTLPSLPAVPALPTIAFAAPTEPGAFTDVVPTLTVDTFSDVAPTTTFPVAPTLSYGAAPTIPSAAAITVPDAPLITLPSAPSYLSLSSPTFVGVDLHAAFLTNFDNIPTLTLVAPTPYSYALGAEYASTLLSTLKSVLNTRMAGGTGLNTAVEQAIWDRARSRETQIALGNESEIMRASEAMGFQLPTGVLAAQLREAQQGYYDKLSGLSRDVAIKQADLEQANLQQTITAGMALESQLIDYSYKLEQLTFETAKTQADNAIQVHNSQIEKYKALLGAYQVYAEAYRAIISAELAKVEVYKAEIAGEQAKADVNKTLVEQYKATIEASMSQVEIYKAQVGAANTLVQIEQVKISAAGEQIKAYVAQINGETAKIEAYKAGIQAEVSKVDVYKVKAGVFRDKVSAQAEVARLELGRFDSVARVKSLEWDGYRARTDAERIRMQALASQSGAMLDGYKAGAAAVQAEAGMHTQVWETQIKDYEAAQQITIQAAKINGDAMQFSYASIQDAAKVGAQVYAQQVGSAYSMIHASAGVSGTGSTSVNYSYSNDTTDKPTGLVRA